MLTKPQITHILDEIDDQFDILIDEIDIDTDDQSLEFAVYYDGRFIAPINTSVDTSDPKELKNQLIKAIANEFDWYDFDDIADDANLSDTQVATLENAHETLESVHQIAAKMQRSLRGHKDYDSWQKRYFNLLDRYSLAAHEDAYLNYNLGLMQKYTADLGIMSILPDFRQYILKHHPELSQHVLMTNPGVLADQLTHTDFGLKIAHAWQGQDLQFADDMVMELVQDNENVDITD